MRHTHPKADRRRRDAINQAVSGFESEYLKDVVTDRLHYGTNPVLEIADAMERAYDVGEGKVAEDTDAQRKALSAAHDLDDALDLEAAAAVFDVVEQVAADEIPLENYPDETGGPAMKEAVRIVENGSLPDGGSS